MIPNNAPQWLKDSYTENAVVEIVDGWVVWLGGDFLGGNFLGVEITAIRAYASLYRYQVGAAITPDGKRWVRMGCLWYTLADWKRIGIRKSNILEFPDDGSEKSEERVAAFEFAKKAALRLPLPSKIGKTKNK